MQNKKVLINNFSEAIGRGLDYSLIKIKGFIFFVDIKLLLNEFKRGWGYRQRALNNFTREKIF